MPKPKTRRRPSPSSSPRPRRRRSRPSRRRLRRLRPRQEKPKPSRRPPQQAQAKVRRRPKAPRRRRPSRWAHDGFADLGHVARQRGGPGHRRARPPSPRRGDGGRGGDRRRRRRTRCSSSRPRAGSRRVHRPRRAAEAQGRPSRRSTRWRRARRRSRASCGSRSPSTRRVTSSARACCSGPRLRPRRGGARGGEGHAPSSRRRSAESPSSGRPSCRSGSSRHEAARAASALAAVAIATWRAVAPVRSRRSAAADGRAAAHDRPAEAREVRRGRVPAVRGGSRQGRHGRPADRHHGDGRGRRRRGARVRRPGVRRAPRSRRRRQFVFEPALVDGKPIPVKITYRYVFTFDEKMVKKTTGDFAGTCATARPSSRSPTSASRSTPGSRRSPTKTGKFSIPDVPAGEHAVTLSGEQLATVGTTETFEVAKQHRRDLRGRAEEGEERQRRRGERRSSSRAPRIKKQVVSTEVAAEQATRVPGTQGDVLKVVENLPGVARAAVGSGALVVWGSAPQDTRVYVDGRPRAAPLPRRRIPLDRELATSSSRWSSSRAATGAEFGRGLGGLVTVALKPLDERGHPRQRRRRHHRRGRVGARQGRPTMCTSPSPRERATSTRSSPR